MVLAQEETQTLHIMAVCMERQRAACLHTFTPNGSVFPDQSVRLHCCPCCLLSLLAGCRCALCDMQVLAGVFAFWNECATWCSQSVIGLQRLAPFPHLVLHGLSRKLLHNLRMAAICLSTHSWVCFYWFAQSVYVHYLQQLSWGNTQPSSSCSALNSEAIWGKIP